ncbi:hypothetical protein [Paenibacillus lutrae]|uniref:Uncharacterized protein n=1 Tax=Paenibacillus lutrae TaxID=2078573 RepID=A0A7X3FF78_9BACL|nr:hypothetical protein [Paenibacillus lutrae]MVO98572.1 hypothetical protein [Paenibacillus lutrae]
MISDEQLDQYRVEGTLLRIVRDADPRNDIRGYIVAWSEKKVIVRKRTRKVVELDRGYVYQPYIEARPPEFTLPKEEDGEG